MIWMKRRFPDLGYVPYMDRLESLLHEMPNSYSEFLMFWMETGKSGIRDYFIGVPTIQLLPVFDGFDTVAESELPKEIDGFLLGDQTKEPFRSRFTFKRLRQKGR